MTTNSRINDSIRNSFRWLLGSGLMPLAWPRRDNNFDDGGFLFKLCHTRDEQQQRENPKHLSGWTARRTTMASNTYLPTPSDEQQRWHPHRKGSFERRTGATSVWKWSLRNQATNKSQCECVYMARSHLLLRWRLVHLVHRAEERNPCIGCI